MTMISLIAVVDELGGLGHENKLLCHLPADLKHFKEVTLGKPVIMGRKTYQSMGKALPGRHNIVLSKQDLSINDATVVHSLQQALEVSASAPEIMIIGGAQLFEQAMSQATRIYLTKIHATFVADVFFPKIDEKLWSCKEMRHKVQDENNPYDLTFYCYERMK